MNKRLLLMSLSMLLSIVAMPIWAQTKPTEVKITTQKQTITVDENGVNFYDDGGPTGNVTPETGGIVTFEPATTGKKVMVDFKKLDLANFTMYYHAIEVYNGKSTDKSNLLTTFRGKQTGIVRSSSDDGALTVKFFNNASHTTFTGFEAFVSQYTPEKMVVKAFDVKQITDGTVCADDKDQQILSFNIKAENTLNPLTTQKFKFNTNGTNAQIAHAKLYFTNKTNTFATAKMIGETDVTADEFEISTTEITLSEGDNYFYLTYNISETAEENTTIDAALVSATLSGAEQKVAMGSPEGNRIVKNVVIFEDGTHVRKVNQQVVFKDKKGYSYSKKYEATTTTRSMTFIPVHNGMKAQIDFSRFDIMYSSSSILGVRAKFAVYSGQGTSGKLLWELNNHDDAAKGPQKILRSEAADGAITIIFNPNTYTSSYCGTGFDAIVSEYQSKQKEIKAVTATQLSNAILAAGDKNAEIIGFNIQSEGDQDEENLNGITLDLKESLPALAKVTVVSTGAKDVAEPNQQVAAVTSFGSNNQLKVALNAPFALQEGDNFFRILFDVKDDAVAETKLDAAVTAINVNGTDKQIETANPDGERIVKNMVVLKNGEHLTKKVQPGTSIMFYDDGGASAKESQNFNGSITFVPGTEGYTIKLTKKEWNLTAYDAFNISFGEKVKTPADFTYGFYQKFDEIISKSEDGKLTVNHTTKKYTGDGFAIEVSAIKAEKLAIESVKTFSIAPTESMKGKTDLAMTRVEVTTKGTFGAVNVEKMALKVGGDNIVKNAKVYFTGTNNTFANTNLFGSATATPYEITGKATLDDQATYYFWVAYDLDSKAAVGNKATVEVGSITANGSNVNPTGSNVAATTIRKGISGTLMVGQAEKYKTIQSAVDALKEGIDGSVTINITPGLYNEKVNVPEIEGMSEVNKLTIQSATKKADDVKIYFDQYAEPGYSDDKQAHQYGVFTFDGADYTTLKNVQVTTKDLKFKSVVHVRNMSQHVTIDGCHIYCAETENNQTGISLIGMYSKDIANQNNDYITIKNNILDGGYIGVKLGGTTNIALPKELGGIVMNNILRNQGSMGIYGNKEENAKIVGNSISNNVSQKSGFHAIDVWGFGTYSIESNKINLKLDNSPYGMYIRAFDMSSEKPATIANNSIVIEGKKRSYGIDFNKTASNVNIANNTIRLVGSDTGSQAINFGKGKTNMIFTQNIVQNEAGGYAINVSNDAALSGWTLKNNNIYSTGTKLASASNDIADFASWIALTKETGSYNDKVEFLDDEVLEPKDVLNLTKTEPLAYVTKDIANTKRNAQTPTMGAYEFNANGTTPNLNYGYPKAVNITKNSADIKIKPTQNGKAHIIVKKASEPAPTAEKVLASTQILSVTRMQESLYTVNNLEAENEYIAYVVIKGLRGKAGKLAQSKPFKATEAIPLPEPKIKANNVTVNEGEKANLTAEVAALEPYTVRWYNAMREEVKADVVPTQCEQYTAEVTDVNGKKATAICDVIVKGKAVTATLENLYLEPESYWSGLDGTGYFLNGSYKFDNFANKEYDTYANAMYSNQTSTYYKDLTDGRYHSAVGSGVDKSNNFGIFYPEGGKISVMNTEEGDTIRGFYVTNHAWVYKSVLEGDGMSTNDTPEKSPFKKGDFFKLIVTGVDGEGNKKNAEFYLADYRSEKEADHYVLNTWEWVDLTSLGKVKYVTFNFDGTKRNQPIEYGWRGITTPRYFCFDNFGATRTDKKGKAITPKETADNTATADVSNNFETDGTEATKAYKVVEILPNTTKAQVTIDENGKLTITSNVDESFEVVVSMTQKGKTQYVKIPITYTTGISTISEEAGATINIENGQVVVNGIATDYTVELLATNGILVHKAIANGNNAVRLPNVAKGIYIVKIHVGQQTITKSIIVR